jgi:teichuronic acid biosynthesis glycosyltransferase TuaH
MTPDSVHSPSTLDEPCSGTEPISFVCLAQLEMPLFPYTGAYLEFMIATIQRVPGENQEGADQEGDAGNPAQGGAMRMFDLLILPMHDWKKCRKEGFRTRDGHFMEHFVRSDRVGKILVVDRPVSVVEGILKGNRGPIEGGKQIWRGRNQWLTEAVPGKCYVLDIAVRDVLRPLWMGRDWWNDIFRRACVHAAIREAAERLGMTRPVLFLWSPLSTGVIEAVPHSLLVFDALDNWLNHPIIRDKRGLIAEGYQTIRAKADLISTNTASIAELLSPAARCTPRYVPNGVDPERFARKDLPVPADVRSLPRPIIGYSGKITKRHDLELCEKLLAAFCDCSFVFCGPVLEKGWIRGLLRHPNLHYLGDKHYDDLLAYVANFDVAIIPYDVVRHKIEGEAIKLYEYLAAGLPVVTSRFMGVDAFAPHIWIADTHAEFVESVRNCVELVRAGRRDEIVRKTTGALPADAAWATKADLILGEIERRLEG